MQDRLSTIYQLAIPHIPQDGRTFTDIPFLSFIRTSGQTPMVKGILKPSLCLVVQGKKRVIIGSETINYGKGSYILSSVDIPIAGQVYGASKAEPYLGVAIEIDPAEVASVLMESGISANKTKEKNSGAFVYKSNEDFLECVYRLVKLLDKPSEAKYLANIIKKELIYRLLISEQGLMLSHQDSGISKAISWIRDNFNQPLKIEKLAKDLHMSVSSLQHKFKSATTMGLLQYQKNLRLQEAKRLLLAGGIDVASTAFEVGYESPSQFNREYRRLFGASPLADIKSLHNQAL